MVIPVKIAEGFCAGPNLPPSGFNPGTATVITATSTRTWSLSGAQLHQDGIISCFPLASDTAAKHFE